MVLAHRAAHELWIGAIPDGYTVDHLCHNDDLLCVGGRCPHRRCVEPSHLEAVTSAENNRRRRQRFPALVDVILSMPDVADRIRNAPSP